jgi:hypothetical protein
MGCSFEKEYAPAMLGPQFYGEVGTAAISTQFKNRIIIDSPSGQENESPSSALTDTDKEILNFRISCLSQEIKELRELLVENNSFDPIIGVSQTQIYNLGTVDYELVEPINVLIKIYKEETIALIPDLELYAEGSNEIESINNLKIELLDLFDDLNDMEDEELGVDPRNWKKTLNRLIKKCR